MGQLICLPVNGVQNAWCAKRLAAELAKVPWPLFTLRSDQEPAILALKVVAANRVQHATSKDILFEEYPVGASAANGLAENAVEETRAGSSYRCALHSTSSTVSRSTFRVRFWLEWCDMRGQ